MRSDVIMRCTGRVNEQAQVREFAGRTFMERFYRTEIVSNVCIGRFPALKGAVPCTQSAPCSTVALQLAYERQRLGAIVKLSGLAYL